MNSQSIDFEVTYTALQAPESFAECVVVVTRAIQAMVSSAIVTKADAAMYFKHTQGASFTVRSSSADDLLRLPLSYGSAIGHFGVFERGLVCVIPKFHAVYSISRKFKSYSSQTRSRLAREVGERLKAYVDSRSLGVEVHLLAESNILLVISEQENEIKGLPMRFNAVFERSPGASCR